MIVMGIHDHCPCPHHNPLGKLFSLQPHLRYYEHMLISVFMLFPKKIVKVFYPPSQNIMGLPVGECQKHWLIDAV